MEIYIQMRGMSTIDGSKSEGQAPLRIHLQVAHQGLSKFRSGGKARD